MSNNGTDVARRSPPQRPRHQLTRSITELSSPIRLHRNGSMRRERSRRRAKDRDHDDLISILQSSKLGLSLSQSRSSFDGSRSEGMTPNLSPDASRRTSVLIIPADDTTSTAAATPAIQTSALTSAVVPSQPPRDDERQRALARENRLRKALEDLSVFSTTSARRLDDMYYSVLEKLGSLQSTIVALKELAISSHDLTETFNKESRELENEVNNQLDSFGPFDDQQKRIESLQVRIHNGRDKVQSLSERVDTVRERIEGWERADREWQEKTRKRLKAIWVVTSITLGFILLLVVSIQYASIGLDDAAEATVRFANSSLNTIKDATKAATEQGVLDFGSSMMGGDGNEANHSGTESSRKADDLLRVFDEL